MASRLRGRLSTGARKLKELVIKRPGQPLRRKALEAESLSLGRDLDCSIVLDSHFVSRRHAILEKRGDSYEIADAGSRNGVLVNGDRLTKPRRLKKGDEIIISDFSLTYWESDSEGLTATFDQVSDDLVVNADTREVWLGLRRLNLQLSRQEFDLLSLLFANGNKVCRREEIGEVIWGSEVIDGRKLVRYDENMIHRLVSRLKAKLEPEGLADRLTNLPGVGYRLKRST